MELRECPMCGVIPSFTSTSRWKYAIFHTCENGVEIKVHSGRKADVVKAWNTRHDGGQEISLAPKDGTVVLITGYNYNDPVKGRWTAVAHSEGSGWFEENELATEALHPPTHFRHLPKSPGEGR